MKTYSSLFLCPNYYIGRQSFKAIFPLHTPSLMDFKVSCSINSTLCSPTTPNNRNQAQFIRGKELVWVDVIQIYFSSLEVVDMDQNILKLRTTYRIWAVKHCYQNYAQNKLAMQNLKWKIQAMIHSPRILTYAYIFMKQ